MDYSLYYFLFQEKNVHLIINNNFYVDVINKYIKIILKETKDFGSIEKRNYLISLKINLGFSILSYDDLEKYIFDFININSPKLTEKILLTNLKINGPEKMKELIELVYLKANIEKIVIKLNNDNIDLLSKLLSKFIIEYKNKYTNYINSLILLLNHPNMQKINNNDIKKSLCDYLIFSKTRALLCDEIS